MALEQGMVAWQYRLDRRGAPLANTYLSWSLGAEIFSQRGGIRACHRGKTGE